MDDEQAMKRVLLLAGKGRQKVSPNPLVGAVILKDGILISEGWHKEFGGNHAEIEAIKNAKNIDLNGATLVVNLEPCSHFGKTPPCVDTIIKKKFSRVVIGMIDPNPLVAGKGIKALQKAGIECKIGVLEEECRWLNRVFIKNMTDNMPYIILKVAQSLDSFIATSNGESKWITSEESRRRSHKLRAIADAVLIGRNTAQIDNPKLTVRNVKGLNPKRILLDTNLSLPLTIDVFNDATNTDVFVCCNKELSNSKKSVSLRKKGIHLIPFELDSYGKLDLKLILKDLYIKYKITSVLVEGGAEIFSNFAKNKLIDELHIFSAPIIIGNGVHSFNNVHTDFLKDVLKFKIIKVSKSGTDVHIIAIK